MEYYGHGKLLLTGEYFVLDGATGLAAPTRLGQQFFVEAMPTENRYDLIWTMHVPEETDAREYGFAREDWSHTQLTDDPVRSRLQQLFYAAEQLRPRCTVELLGRRVSTYLEFPADWGLGSSSTLVDFLARLLKVNAYDLLELSFGGSGYDLACAAADGPILYDRKHREPVVQKVAWNPAWKDKTFFVHRNRKQDSRQGIAKYRGVTKEPAVSDRISAISHALLGEAPDLRSAARLLEEHERLVGEMLGVTPVKMSHFSDFKGTVKSLGAWGGDFVWALSEQPAESVQAYFNERGYPTVIPYKEMIL